MQNDLKLAKNGDNYEISNSKLKIAFEKDNNIYQKSFFVNKDNNWIRILSEGNEKGSGMELNTGKSGIFYRYESLFVETNNNDKIEIVLAGNHTGGTIEQKICLENGLNFIYIRDSFTAKEKVGVSSLLTHYSFVPEGKNYEEYKPLDFVFTPTLRPKENHVIADHVFRSPAVILQKQNLTAAIIPDILSLDKDRKMRNIMDLQVDTLKAPFFSFGCADWQVEEHVYYYHNNDMLKEINKSRLTYAYYIFLDGESKDVSGHEKIVRFMWDKFGSESQKKNTGALNKTLDEWGKACWYDYAKDVWMDVNINGEEAGALKMNRLSWSNNLHKSADNDAWFNVWFQNLRTAYGMYIYGQQNSDPELMKKGIKVLKLALNAPQKEGIFGSIYYEGNGPHWVGDQGWGAIGGNFYSTFHSSFQCYWLLKWFELVEEKDLRERIIKFCDRYAEFVMKHQYESGVLPSWYDMESMLPSPMLETVNAETAAASLFLTEFFRITKYEKYLSTALKAVEYLEKEIIPENKWFDYETFFSCSRKPVDFYDNYTKQHPQNTLSLYMAVETYKNLYLITKDESTLKKGLRLLDYLLLYQQVWSPMFLSRQLLGGFGVQNTDGEWSDAREAYFAITLIDFFEITGKKEYFERAIEAARSLFGCYEEGTSRCYENYSHSGTDRVTGVTGILWGTGSTMTSITMITQKYGDLYIDIKNNWGKAINYFWMENLVIEGTKISFDIKQPEKLNQDIKIVFGNYKPVTPYEIFVNGKRIGKFADVELKGVKVSIS